MGHLRQQLDDPAYPRITYRRGAAGSPEPVLRGSGLRVRTVAVAARTWGLSPVRVAEEYGQPEDVVREALASYDALRIEVDAAIDAEALSAEEANEPRNTDVGA